MTRRILVTGGCGFVGVPLVRRLVARGDDVLVYDNMCRGARERLDGGLEEQVRVVQADIRDSQRLAETLRDHKSELLIHLAAMHFIPDCDSDPEQCLSNNVAGTQSVLGAAEAARHDLALVYASTAAVYEPDERVHCEDSSRAAPTDVYGYSKLAGEQLVTNYSERTGMPASIARLFNVYGAAETNPHLIPTIARQAETSDVLHLGNLQTRRDYVFTDDVARALALMGDKTTEGESVLCNVGTGVAWSGAEIVETMGHLLGRQLDVVLDPDRTRPADRPMLCADNSRAKQALGWRPQVDIEAGLQAALDRPVGPGVKWR